MTAEFLYAVALILAIVAGIWAAIERTLWGVLLGVGLALTTIGLLFGEIGSKSG
jgi:hypothetical protein